jgi:tetratricopeptide (TPR) repeat protein
MAEDRLRQGERQWGNTPGVSNTPRGRNVPRILAPGEKPVLNEKYISPLPEARREPVSKKAPKHNDVFFPETENAEKKPFGDKRLREGMRLFNVKQWEQALREFLLVEADNLTNEEKPELTYYLGLCCAKLEKYEDAVRYLEQVVAECNDPVRVKDPERIGDPLRGYQCRMTLAYIYIKTGRVKMAEFELKRLKDAGFESALLYSTLGYAAYVQKRYGGAVDFYEKSLELDPDSTTAMNCLGYILADRGIDTAKALRLCRRAAKMQPQNPAYLDSLGWACYKARETEEARNWLRKALDLAPQEKEIREHFRIISGGLPSVGGLG